MNENQNKMRLVVVKDRLDMLNNIDLSEYGYEDSANCIFEFDGEAGTAKLLHFCEAIIDGIEEADEDICKIYSEKSTKLAHETIESKFPKSGATILGLHAGLNSIKLGLFELCRAMELYSINALYRVFLEHFLKLNFLFFRIIVDKNDTVGEEYVEFMNISETLNYGKSINQINLILELENQGKDAYQVLCEIDPKYKKISKSKIENKIKQFSYKNMIKYVISKEKEVRKNSIPNPIILILPEYSELSSYIHGGPTALKNTNFAWQEKKVERKCAEIARSSFYLSTISKIVLCILFGLTIDKSYFLLEKKIQKQWDESSDQIEKYFQVFNSKPTAK